MGEIKTTPLLGWGRGGGLRGPLGWERDLERRTQKNQAEERGMEKETQMQRRNRKKQRERKKRQSQSAEAKRQTHRERERQSLREGKRDSPHLQEGGGLRQLLGWVRPQPAGLRARGRDRTHLEAVRVPQGGGCGEEARHEPRLKRESSRILQRPGLARGGDVTQTGFSGLTLLLGERGQSAGQSWAPQED